MECPPCCKGTRWKTYHHEEAKESDYYLPDLHHFLLGDDAFALMPWMVKPYSSSQLTTEERITNYSISRSRKVVENAFGILVSRFTVLLGTMKQRPRVVRDIILTSMVLQNMLRTHQCRAYRAPTPANDVAALQNEQVVYVPDDNYRNPLREAKHLANLQDLQVQNLLNYHNLLRTSRLSQRSKLKRLDPKVKTISKNVNDSYKSKCFLLFEVKFIYFCQSYILGLWPKFQVFGQRFFSSY